MVFLRSSSELSHKLNNTRAIAALCVVFYHYFIFFFTSQAFSAKLSCFPPLEFSAPFIQDLKDFPFDLGRFSVTLFFLLSGFLTPYLLEKYPTRSAFFKNRFFRLWPVYAVGLSINLLFVWMACEYNNIEVPHEFEGILAAFFALRDFLGYPYITGVVWTFEIEVKFIFFCILVFPLIQKVSLKNLVILKTILFLGCYYITFFVYDEFDIEDGFFIFCKVIAFNLKFFCFLLIGMCFYYFLSKKILKKEFLRLTIILSLLFILEAYLTLRLQFFIQYIASYFPAFFIFLWYILKDFSNSQSSSVLKFIANMSYPLYLIHAIPGYILMYILYDQGVPLFVGIGIACPLLFGLSYLVHRFIEVPIRDKWSHPAVLFHKK